VSDGEPGAYGLRSRRIKALKPKPSGGRQRQNIERSPRRRRCWPRFAKAAGAGEMLTSTISSGPHEQAIGHQTSNSTVYNLLHRHGWRKLMRARPFHPKRDVEAQKAFKKTGFSPRCSESAAGRHAGGRPCASCSPTKRRVRTNEPAAAMPGGGRV